MSKQISIPGFITAMAAKSWEKGDANVIDGMAFAFWPFEPVPVSGYVTVCQHTMTFDIPEGFDPRPQQIAALQAKEQKLRADFSKAVMEINAQIQSLQAIEHTSAAEPFTVDADDELPF